MRFPVDCDTPAQRMEYGYRAQELLRLLHNAMLYWSKVEVTEAQWQKLPQKIKNRYPYKPQLTKGEWNDFDNNVFNPLSLKISGAIGQQRIPLMQSTKWTIDVGEI